VQQTNFDYSRELLPVQQTGSYYPESYSRCNKPGATPESYSRCNKPGATPAYSRELLPVQQAPGRNPNPLKCLFSKPSQLLLLKLTCELHEPVTASDASQHECFEVADDQVMG
jgi:hypothetical protein